MNKLERKLRAVVQHCDHVWYWRTRDKILYKKYPRILKVWMLYRLKKCDAFNNASMGTFLGHGAEFATPPILQHGLYGIIVSQNAKIGKNCTILHQVTIGEGKGEHRLSGIMCILGQVRNLLVRLPLEIMSESVRTVLWLMMCRIMLQW